MAAEVSILDQWAAWGRLCAPERPQPNWSSVRHLIAAAEPPLLEDSRKLLGILEESETRLGFTDPLLSDLGVHRWLGDENSYSDWLAWTLQRLDDPEGVLRVLGIRDDEFAKHCEGPYTVDREWPLERGFDGSTGRIDLMIRYKRAVIGVEVKTEDDQYGKQRGYKESIEKLCKISGATSKCALIAKDEVPAECRFGFDLRKWEDVSLALRREAVRFKAGTEQAAAAMMIGFIAAIEQNLLRLGTGAAARAKKNLLVLLTSQLREYVDKIGDFHG